MSRYLLILIILLTTGCGQDDPKVNDTAFSKAKICMAGIAAMNGHDPIYDLVSTEKEITELQYTRKVDGRKFIYECKINNDEINWRMKEYSGGLWNKNLRLFFALNDEVIVIRQFVMGELIDSRLFKYEELAGKLDL